MKAAVVEVKPLGQEYVAKEMAGGLGKRLSLSKSVLGRILDHYLQSRFSAPPMILAQVAGVFHKHGWDVQAYHTAEAADLRLDSRIVVVLSSMVDYRNEVRFIRETKRLLPDAKVIVVGSFASTMPEVYRDAADSVIVGSPELAVEDIVTGKGPQGKVINATEPNDLNSLPMIDWTPFLRNGSYSRRPFSNELGISVQKSRGCTMTCNYCPYAAIYGNAKHYSVDQVMKTIGYYHDHHGIRYFMFRDPNFGEKRSELRAFIHELRRSRFQITWSCEMRLDMFEDQDLSAMAEAGLRYVITGIESSNDDILSQNMRKAYRKEDTFRKLALLERAGVVVQTNWIIGFPHETQRSVLDTVAYSKELNTMFATFHIFTPQPGTDVFNSYKDKFLRVDWEDFNYSHLVWSHDTLSKEFLEKSLHDAYVGYYFRPTWLIRHASSFGRLLLTPRSPEKNLGLDSMVQGAAHGH